MITIIICVVGIYIIGVSLYDYAFKCIWNDFKNNNGDYDYRKD